MSKETNEQKRIAKAGSLLRVEQGEYSCYEVIGFFVVLQDFSPLDEKAEYLEQNRGQIKAHRFESEQFLAHILRKGLILEIDSGVLHLGSYGDGDVNFWLQTGYGYSSKGGGGNEN